MAPTLPFTSPTAVHISAIVAGAVSGYHVLKIDGHSRTKHAIPNGKYVDSRPFNVGGHTWAMRYYPNGNGQDRADYISLYLVIKSRIYEDVAVQCVLGFTDGVEKRAPSHIRTLAAIVFSDKNTIYGHAKFIKREDLERSKRLKDDCFTIRCDMIVIGEVTAEDTVASSIIVPPPDWPQHFRALLLNEEGADVRFRVGDEELAAHRCVLAARSPVFRAELFGAMKEGTTTVSCVQIDDILPQVLKCLLHFIYTDLLTEIEEGQDDDSPAMAQHFLEAADRYGMQRLKLVCEDILCRCIDVNTVATTLAKD